MVMACAIPEACWTPLVGAVCGGALVYLTQKLVERREFRNRRDQLRLDLYLSVVDLVQDNELELAERGAEGSIPPVELQAKRYRILHRLKLLGSEVVRSAYDEYDRLVFQSTVQSSQFRPKNPDDVTNARNRLIELMAKDVQGTACKMLAWLAQHD